MPETKTPRRTIRKPAAETATTAPAGEQPTETTDAALPTQAGGADVVVPGVEGVEGQVVSNADGGPGDAEAESEAVAGDEEPETKAEEKKAAPRRAARRTLLQRLEELHVPIWSGRHSRHICAACGGAGQQCRTLAVARSGKPEPQMQADVLALHGSDGLPGRAANCRECRDVTAFPCSTARAVTGEAPAAPEAQPAPAVEGTADAPAPSGTAAPW